MHKFTSRLGGRHWLHVFGLVILIGTLFLSWYLWICRFRVGEGVTLEYLPGRQSKEEALRSFITAFSIFATIQVAILSVGIQKSMKRNAKIFGVSSFASYVVGLFWSITLILSSSLGGVSVPLWNYPVLVFLLGFGLALTVFLLTEIVE